jgi:hypothetical protein
MAGNLEFIKSASGTSVSSLSVTDCFSANYDVYQIVIGVSELTTGNGWVKLRFLDSSGTEINQTEYDYASLVIRAYSAFLEEKATSVTYIDKILHISTDLTGSNTWINIFNPYDSSSYTFTQSQSNGNATTPYFIGNKAIGVHKVAEQLSGIILYPPAGNFASIDVSVYGVK